VVAVCSNPIRFSDGRTEHTFVLVFHGFVLKDTNPGSAGTNYTYEASKTDLWPYNEQFLEKQKMDVKLSEAEHQAAIGLLSVASAGTQTAAALWANKACEGKEAEQCVELGLSCYRDFRASSAEEDFSRAAALFQIACDGGVAAGCYNVGVFYAGGTGVPKDKTKAAAFFQKACDGGSANGCYRIGAMYAHGTGVSQDKARAAALYQKGCDGHSKEACDALKRGVQ